ncbi:MAG: hypothetical protein ABSD75_19120 [Terriglobales bacterium]|jgi:hypothetical protein
MKRFALSLFPILTIVLAWGGTALSQGVGDNSVYFVTYYSNANTTGAPDPAVRVINDGDTGANLWASFYSFDDSQEMQECCSCQVSPDGLTSESVGKNLTSNSLTGRVPTRGVIKVISSSANAGGPTNFTNTPTPGLRVWSTHIQRVTPTSGDFHLSEALAGDSNLAPPEETLIETLCLYINLLGGGGQGVCSCTPEGQDF